MGGGCTFCPYPVAVMVVPVVGTAPSGWSPVLSRISALRPPTNQVETASTAASGCGLGLVVHAGMAYAAVTVHRRNGSRPSTAPGEKDVPAPVPASGWAAVSSRSCPGLSTTLAVQVWAAAAAVRKNGSTAGSVDGPVVDEEKNAGYVRPVPETAVTAAATASVTTTNSWGRCQRTRRRDGFTGRGGAPTVVGVKAMRGACSVVDWVAVTAVDGVRCPVGEGEPGEADGIPRRSDVGDTPSCDHWPVPAAVSRPRLITEIRRFGNDLATMLAGLDPRTLHPSDAAVLVNEVVSVERRLAGLRLACAARAAESSAVAASGSRSAEHWYAEQVGVGLPAARRSLQTSQRLQELQRTREQAMAGALSEVQVDRVADAAFANPRSEGELLRAARRSGMRGLAAVCDRAKAEVSDEHAEQQRLAAVHRRRFLRHSRTADGAFRLEVHTTPDAGAQVMAAVERRADQLFHVARRQGRREPHHAYQVDALVDLVTAAVTGARSSDTPDPADRADAEKERGSAAGQRGQSTGLVATITFLVDAEAFRRGRLGSGERCELAGVGPVPLSMVERYVGASRVDLVVTRGVDVASVVSLGRVIPRALRVALQVRDATCVVPGCDVSSPLEIDHIEPFARGGPTRLSNLCRLCPHHHDLKTYRGWTIRGGPGAWEWRRPDEPGDPDSTSRIDGCPAPASMPDAASPGVARTATTSRQRQGRPPRSRSDGPTATAGHFARALFDSA